MSSFGERDKADARARVALLDDCIPLSSHVAAPVESLWQAHRRFAVVLNHVLSMS
jgi:hypothetical protein